VWNDLEEMYSFDLGKVEDMITKHRTASAEAGVKELHEIYSFDVDKMEDLASKGRAAVAVADTEGEESASIGID